MGELVRGMRSVCEPSATVALVVLPDASILARRFKHLKALDPHRYDRIVSEPEAEFPGLPPLIIDDLCAVYGGSWTLLPHVADWVRRYLPQPTT